MDIALKIAEEINVKKWQVEAAIKLVDEGNTIPFIARYRKEATGTLNDEQLRQLYDRLIYLRNLEEKKESVIASIDEQGLLTDELRKQIIEAQTQVALDDLYRPYRPKRRTRAMVAKERGLEGLANIILLQAGMDIEKEALAYVDPEKEVINTEEAINGAMDIIAESISDNAEYREYIRNYVRKSGLIKSRAKGDGENSVYEMYYDFSEGVSKIAGHRVLAINRGEKEKILSVSIECEEDRIISYLAKRVITKPGDTSAPYLNKTIEDAYARLIFPAIEREIRNELTERAELGAISVFGKNLKQLLLVPPVAGHTVLGWDPAFRTGCKLAIVDKTGKVLDTKVIYPTAPQNKVDEAKAELKKLINKYNVTLISVGNGTASRESEMIIAEFIKEEKLDVKYVITNEAGASVYSASKLAADEFPEFDVGQRSAISIARRVLDPLSELVKIDPKSIGVGQYQHDMNQKLLGETLSGVVEDCVNHVGVDLNTASAALLEYVSGISKILAKNIVAYREEIGSFKNRKQLLAVPKLGPKAYEQCAGFLRIREGDEMLDNTAVHPESYEVAKKILEEYSDIAKLISDKDKINNLAEKLAVGRETLVDILQELLKPGRDIRYEGQAVVLKSDVLDIKDLKPGMELKGTVRNVIDFGVFVDIGVHQDGLVHISQICDRYIKHPLEVVSVGDIVNVKVLEFDEKKKRIALTMKGIKQ